MTTVTRTALRGLLIQHPHLKIDAYSADLSSVNQAGARPGVPTPPAGQSSSLVLKSSGTATSALHIRTRRGGHPDGNAAFVWRYDGDTDYRGWDGPQVMTDWEFLARSTTAGDYTHPHAVTLADGTVVVAVEYQKQSVRVFRCDPSDGTWTDVEVLNDGSPLTYGLYPCLLLLPSGVLQCFSYREASNKIQIRMHYSTDNGVSWTLGQKSVLPSAIAVGTYITNRFRVGYLNRSIILVAEVIDFGALENQLWQYSSVDFGANFVEIAKLTGVSRAYPTIIQLSGALLVVYLAYRSSIAPHQLPYYRRLGNASDSLTDIDPTAIDVAGSMEWGTMSGTAFAGGDLGGWLEGNIVYLLGRDDGGSGELYLLRSKDQGDTWEPVGMDGDGAADGATVWNGASTSIYPTDFAATPCRGRVLVAHRFSGGVGSDSLCAAWLGGYTTITMPQADNLTDDPNDQIGWQRTWLPFDEPQNIGTTWTRATVGSPTITLDDEGLKITGTSGDSAQWQTTPTAALDEGITAQASINTAAGIAYLSVRISDGVGVCYQARLEVEDNQIILRDLFGSTLATLTFLSALGDIQVWMSVGNGKVSAWYMQDGGQDRQWTEIVSSVALTASILTTSLIAFGVRDDTATDVHFRRAVYSAGPYNGTGLHRAYSNPSDLLPRPYSVLPISIAEGLTLQAVKGPTFHGETWDMVPEYSYSIKEIHPDFSPSPRCPWRSTNTSPQSVVWEVGTSLADTQGFIDRIYGIYLGGINFPTAELWGRDDTGTWFKLVDIDARTGMTGLGFVRRGAAVRPSSGSAKAGHYLPMNVLKDGTFYNGTVARKIQTNTDGTWGGGRSAQLLLAAHAVGDATSGTGEFWSPEVVATFESPVGTPVNAFKLVIPSHDTADGYFQIGVCMIGPVIVLGDEYSLGRSLGVDGSWTVTETRGGMETYKEGAPISRSAEIDWTEGIDASDVTDADPDPDAIAGRDGGPTLAADGAAPYLIPGLYTFLKGAMNPLVYLPSFNPSSATSIANRQRMLYGRIVTESLRSDSVLGAEWGDNEPGEMFRISKAKIKEIT